VSLLRGFNGKIDYFSWVVVHGSQWTICYADGNQLLDQCNEIIGFMDGNKTKALMEILN
jgi:hypothetical protein